MNKNKIKFVDLKIEDFINTDYLDYSRYTIYNRAIPSMIDSFKPSQRKIIYTANKVSKDLKKTSALAGDVVSIANYHHGSTSLEDTIVGMTRKGNNLSFLDGKGYFGTRVVPKAAAARYTQSKIGGNFAKYFLDNEICPKQLDPDDPEPMHYLPIIPTLLINGIHGIAVGFASTIQPRDPKLLTKLCAAHLIGRDISKIDIPPHFSDFTGKIVKSVEDGEIKWKSIGTVTHKKNNVYVISELPCGYKGKDRIQFVKILNEMVSMGAIMAYKDRCSKLGFNFELKLKHKIPRDQDIKSTLKNEIRQKWDKANKKVKNLDKELDKEVLKLFAKRVKLLSEFAINGRDPSIIVESLINNLSLIENLNDNITVTDENGNLKVFKSVNELIKHFVDYRLSMYTKRFEYRIERDTKKLNVAKTKYGFIKAIINDKIVLKGKSKKEIIDMLVKLGIDREMVETLISLPLHNICNDELLKLKQTCTDLQKDIETWKSSDIKKSYLVDLKAII